MCPSVRARSAKKWAGRNMRTQSLDSEAIMKPDIDIEWDVKDELA
jgi:hypothetical protein